MLLKNLTPESKQVLFLGSRPCTSFLFLFLGHPSGAQALLLALHSGVTPYGTQGTI